MANEQNLHPAEYKFTQEDAKKGARNSAKARRKKRMLKDLMAIFGSLELPEGELRDSMAGLGLTDEELTNDMAMVIGQYQAAIKGNPSAATFIRDTKGEKPIEKTESTVIAPKPLIDLTTRKKNGMK